LKPASCTIVAVLEPEMRELLTMPDVLLAAVDVVEVVDVPVRVPVPVPEPVGPHDMAVSYATSSASQTDDCPFVTTCWQASRVAPLGIPAQQAARLVQVEGAPPLQTPLGWYAVSCVRHDPSTPDVATAPHVAGSGVLGQHVARIVHAGEDVVGLPDEEAQPRTTAQTATHALRPIRLSMMRLRRGPVGPCGLPG
jgi:hypothetical protein